MELVIAQRLVRKLCTHCLLEYKIDAKQALLLQNPDLAGKTAYNGRGCIYCGGKGYSGRIGLFEMLPISNDLARDITEEVPETEIIETMKIKGFKNLREDGVSKILSGKTTVEEVLRVVG